MKSWLPRWFSAGPCALIAGVIACRSGVARTSSDVTAVVSGMGGSLESVPYIKLYVEFSNQTTRSITVEAYRVVWPRGRTDVSDIRFLLGPGETKTRTVRINYDASLKATDFRVEVLDWR
jgi:hypothetical protein